MVAVDAQQISGEGGHLRAAAGQGRAKGKDWRACQAGKAGGQGGVVPVGMGDKDMADALARGDGGQNCVKVVWKIGAGVDDGKVGRADQIRIRPRPGQGRRVCGGQAAQGRVAQPHGATGQCTLPMPGWRA